MSETDKKTPQEPVSPLLILASSSSYRAALLKRLGQAFETCDPEVDETPVPGEPPQALASRLALEKAQTVAIRYPNSLVIGSDQVAVCGDERLDKPGDLEHARLQLRLSAGRIVTFYTGVALVCASTGLALEHVEPFEVTVRDLSPAQIDNYLQREEPFDCAGSFKWEGLGIALFRDMRGSDPTSLEGLPLIALTDLLRQAGVDVLGAS